MPLRVAEYVERCSLCDDEQTASCVRCGRPLCGEHDPKKKARRCESCEADYDDGKDGYAQTQLAEFRRNRRERFAAPAIALVIGALALLPIGLPVSVGWTIATSIMVVLLGLITIASSMTLSSEDEALELRRARSVYRQKFLADRPTLRLSSESEPLLLPVAHNPDAN